MSSATDLRRPGAASRATVAALLAVALAAGAPVAAAGPSSSPTPAPARTPASDRSPARPTSPPAAPPPAARLTPSDLRSSLEKADKYLRNSERLVRGDDPGRVSLVLARADEELTRFQEGSALMPLQR